MSNVELIAAARDNIVQSYAPFSKFRAGAAVRCSDDRMVPGVIVENVSLGLSMCAERVAMFSAVAQGTRPVALALAAPDTDGGATWPCGACLQVGLELGGPDMLVVVGDNKGGPVQQSTIGELLPRGPHVNV